jgi:hypothetical protein
MDAGKSKVGAPKKIDATTIYAATVCCVDLCWSTF